MVGKDSALKAPMNWDQILDAITQRACSLQRTELHPSDSMPLGPPFDVTTVPLIETHLGFPLPPLLVDLYVKVGNGGFGPGYGLMRLAPSEGSAWGGNAVAVHRFMQECRTGDDEFPMDAELAWPRGLLPVVHMGCSAYYCIDCGTPDLQVVMWDRDGGDEAAEMPVFEGLVRLDVGFAEWMHRWAKQI